MKLFLIRLACGVSFGVGAICAMRDGWGWFAASMAFSMAGLSIMDWYAREADK